jgi:Ras family protein A
MDPNFIGTQPTRAELVVDKLTVLFSQQGEEIRKKIGAYKYLECSAKTNEGVREVFEHATRAALLSRSNRKSGHKKCLVL